MSDKAAKNLLKKVAKRLEKAAKGNSLKIDLADLGVKTLDEVNHFVGYALRNSAKEKGVLLDESETLLISVPPLKFEPAPDLPSRIPKASGPNISDFSEDKPTMGTSTTGTQSTGTDHLDPMYYQCSGEVSYSEMVGKFEDPVQGLRSQYLSHATTEVKENVLQSVFLGLRTSPIFRGYMESELQDQFKDVCLSKIADLFDCIGVSGDEVEVIRDFTPGHVRGGGGANYCARGKPDLTIVHRVDRHHDNAFPILLTEMKGAPIDRLVLSIRWHFYLTVGGQKPMEDGSEELSQPSAIEMQEAVRIMNQLLGYCLEFSIFEIILSDCRSATLIKFDLENGRRYKSVSDLCDARRIRSSRHVPGKLRKELLDDGLYSIGFVQFKYRTTYYNSTDLPMKFMLSAVAWRQLELVRNGGYAAQRNVTRKYAKNIGLDDQEMAARNKRKANEKDRRDTEKKASKASQTGQGGSSSNKYRRKHDYGLASVVGESIPKYGFDVIQGSKDHIHQVLRMGKDQYTQLFPRVDSSHETVIVKVLDMGELETYYGDRWKQFCESGISCDQFKDMCLDWYRDEVECYLRIGEFNATSEEKILAPKMLDFGSCCISDDSQDVMFDGYYLVLEDLGSRPKVSTLNERQINLLLGRQLDLLARIGISHRDVAARNWIEKDGHIYVIDFNRVCLL